MSSTATARACRLHVTGVVQGVGFRPFVHGLAQDLQLRGHVENTAEGVVIHVEGEGSAVDAFERRLRTDGPPLSCIFDCTRSLAGPEHPEMFEIRASGAAARRVQPVPPDTALCAACRDDLLDPSGRRHRHPFVNCTDCGPRFTIVESLPYDRPRTTMHTFEMCESCESEYSDLSDRRYHAQPIACPGCGPTVSLEDAEGRLLASGDDALRDARRRLRDGQVAAVKGLGGFHLACDARNEAAVSELRRRKGRGGKPFAVMTRDLTTARRLCDIDEVAERLLCSTAAPIALLPRRADADLATGVAPGRDTLGVLLPYTPLHVLLLEPGDDAPEVLVMTSGNVSDEPIVTRNDEARARLRHLADVFLTHDREIRTPCDDSVIRVVDGKTLPVRRSRGYAPVPIELPIDGPSVTAAGAELKNTYCVARDGHAFLGPHVGDLANWETLQTFENSIGLCEELFHVDPVALAHDANPRYLATQYAVERARREGLQTVAVQHHHAHVAACMVEHRLDMQRPVIGVAFDGAGLGDDGAIWGGEFLVATLSGYERAAFVDYVAQPGGDAAARQPWRMALSWLHAAGLPWDRELPSVRAATDAGRAAVLAQCSGGRFAPRTSSVGRLFDAVASLLDLRHTSTFEGEAAMDLESVAAEGTYEPYGTVHQVDDVAGGAGIDLCPLVRAIVADVQNRVPVAVVSARFHESLAEIIRATCVAIRRRRGCETVLLTGGVFQNARLLTRSRARLADAGFDVRSHHVVPPSDGGLALGQAAIATAKLAKES